MESIESLRERKKEYFERGTGRRTVLGSAGEIQGNAFKSMKYTCGGMLCEVG
jgi:hypothetical protein